MVFVAQINVFNNCGISNLVLTFLVRSTNTAPDNKYLTHKKRISNLFLAFANTLFKVSINSAFDIYCFIFSHEKKIIFP